MTRSLNNSRQLTSFAPDHGTYQIHPVNKSNIDIMLPAEEDLERDLQYTERSIAEIDLRT